MVLYLFCHHNLLLLLKSHQLVPITVSSETLLYTTLSLNLQHTISFWNFKHLTKQSENSFKLLSEPKLYWKKFRFKHYWGNAYEKYFAAKMPFSTLTKLRNRQWLYRVFWAHCIPPNWSWNSMVEVLVQKDDIVNITMILQYWIILK